MQVLAVGKEGAMRKEDIAVVTKVQTVEKIIEKTLFHFRTILGHFY
jgi:hypothetical protein